MDKEMLQEIGFSRGESLVYFSLLELGESTIGPISKESSITPAKVYPILDKLEMKGLASHTIKSGIKYFEITSSSNLLRYLDEKKAAIEAQKKKISEILPQIELKRQNRENQTTLIYKGFEGIKTLYEEILEVLLENKEDFIAFTLGEEEYKFPESKHFFRKYDTERRNKGIKVKLIGHDSQRSFFSESYKDPNISIRYLPLRMPTGVIIFGDKVANLVWGEVPTAFVTQSKTVAESNKNFFKDMWNAAKK